MSEVELKQKFIVVRNATKDGLLERPVNKFGEPSIFPIVSTLQQAGEQLEKANREYPLGEQYYVIQVWEFTT